MTVIEAPWMLEGRAAESSSSDMMQQPANTRGREQEGDVFAFDVDNIFEISAVDFLGNFHRISVHGFPRMYANLDMTFQ